MGRTSSSPDVHQKAGIDSFANMSASRKLTQPLDTAELQESAEPRNSQPRDGDAVQTTRGPAEAHVHSKESKSQVNYSSQVSNINLTKKFDDGKSLSSLDRSERRWQQQKPLKQPSPAQKGEGDPLIQISFCQKKVERICKQKSGSPAKRSQGTHQR